MTSSLTPPPPPSASAPRSAPVEVVTPERTRQTRALGFLALVALVSLVRLALPVGIGLFLGALLAFTLQPLYGRLRERGWQMGPAALMCALGATAIVTTTVLAMSTLLVTRGLSLLESVPPMLNPGGSLRGLADD